MSQVSPETKMRPEMGRRYSEQQKADALAALQANGMNVSATAVQLGIPRPTLDLWAMTLRHGGIQAVVERVAPLAKVESAKRDLLGALDAARWQFLEHATRPEVVAKESAYYAVQSFDKLNNAHQLLSGGATSRTELSLASFLGTLSEGSKSVSTGDVIESLPTGGGSMTNPEIGVGEKSEGPVTSRERVSDQTDTSDDSSSNQ